MKAQIFACVLLLVAIFALAASQRFGNATTHSLIRSKKNSKRSSQCQLSIQQSCTSSTKTCGRLGRANICQAFKDDCARQLANCGNNRSTKFFRKVNMNLCRGLAYDTALPCGSGRRKTNRNESTPMIRF